MKKGIFYLAVILMTAIGAHAQQTSPFGTVTGTVTDSSGAVVVNANVVAENVNGGADYKAVTNQSGIYQLPAITAATYTLSVDAPGFARAQKKLSVLVGQVLELNFSLTPTTALTDVVVTATRESTELQKTPVAVTVVDTQDLAQRNIVTARDIAGQVPGVTIQRSGITPLTEVFFIRGIGDADPIFDPNVAQYVDDVYLPRAINGMSDLTDLDRIEVLRGPQGSLFGENADAGAIRYITKTPAGQFHANFDIGYGEYNTFNAHGYVTGAILPKLLGSFAIAHDQHDGYTYDPTIQGDVNNQQTTGARAKLLATLSPGLTLLFTADGLIDRSATDYYVPKQPIIGGTLQKPIYGVFNPNYSYASQSPLNHSRDEGVSLKVSYTINPALIFNSISAGRGFDQDPVNYNNDGQPLVPYSAADPTLVSISDNYIIYKEKEATQEFQLQGMWHKFDFTSGFYFLWEDFSSNRIGYVVSPTAATPLPAYPEDQIGDTGTTNYAVYAQGNYHFTRRLTLTLGGRYTDEHRNFNFAGVYDDFKGNPLPVTPGAPTTTPGGYAAAYNFVYADGKSWNSFSPKFGLSYQFSPGVFGYGSISQGFDAGGFNNRASSIATALPYNQENVWTYEFGFRTDWYHDRLRFNPTVFYNDYTGLQETAAVISPVNDAFVSVRSNAGKAHTEGVELEISAQPVKGLTFTGNGTYLDTRFDSFSNAATAKVNGQTVLVAATGNQLPYSPRWQLFGGASYVLPIDHLHDGFRISADVTHETSYFSDVFNYAKGQVTPQSFVDTYISYKAPTERPLIFSLGVKNIANNLHYQSITWGGTPNLWQGPISPPRTLFFKTAYSF
jgi:iron complex outermembrane recepter protein